MKYTNQNISINNNPVKQVDRKQAKKLYDNGTTIYLNPCNTRLNNAWASPMPLDNKAGEKFETMVNGYEYYNCTNETGTYSNFFTNID